jgi:hypothetical protein
MKRMFMTALVLSALTGIILPAVPATAQVVPAQTAPAQTTVGQTAPAQIIPDQPTPAQMTRTRMICGKRTDIVRQLGEKYGETRRSMGLSGGQGVVELYASDETGSWTILITTPKGTACMMAAGQAFQVEPAVMAGNPV